MVTLGLKVPESGTVRLQLIGGHPPRHKTLRSYQLAHELDGRASISPALKQHVPDLAFVVDRAPEIHVVAGDPDHHLVEVLVIARPRTALSQPSRNHRAEFQHPTADALIGEVEPALQQQLLDVAIAQGEAQMEPNCVWDRVGGKRCRRYEIGNIPAAYGRSVAMAKLS